VCVGIRQRIDKWENENNVIIIPIKIVIYIKLIIFKNKIILSTRKLSIWKK